jgi:hypothetical protein
MEISLGLDALSADASTSAVNHSGAVPSSQSHDHGGFAAALLADSSLWHNEEIALLHCW